MTPGSSRRLLLVAGCLWLAALGARAAEPLPHRSPHESVGTVNCASSTCHGAVTPWETGHVLRNEYTTWSRLDPHTRAWAVLDTARSNEIVRKLGYAQPATKVQACLDCHGHSPPADLRGPRFVASEGVGCEGCHGPAGDWLAPHAREGASHEDNLAHGLYPTDQPLAQARLCLSCHFGDETRFVTHRMMGAGHPRLSFELKTFTALAPAHYRVDEDYVSRKGRPDAMRLWAVGQALAARQQLSTLLDPKRGRQGLMPELVLFDCHACHHPMSELRWQPRPGHSPGIVRLNDSSFLMLRALVRALWPAEAEGFAARILALHKAVAGDAGDPMANAQAVAGLVDAQIPRLAQADFPPATQLALLRALIDESAAPGYADYAGAEQAYMALTSVANALLEAGALGEAQRWREAMAHLLQTLRHDEQFKAAEFRHRLDELRALVAVKTRS